eukprot:scaffold17794_cov57-Phaeocystis_antarctica.AAC.4
MLRSPPPDLILAILYVAVSQVERPELLALRGHRLHRRAGDVAAAPRPRALTPQPRHTRLTAGGRSPPSRSTHSCQAARGDAPPPCPPPIRRARRAPRPAPRRPTCRSRRTEPGSRCRLRRSAAVRACAADRTPPLTQPWRAPPASWP